MAQLLLAKPSRPVEFNLIIFFPPPILQIPRLLPAILHDESSLHGNIEPVKLHSCLRNLISCGRGLCRLLATLDNLARVGTLGVVLDAGGA